MSILVLDCETTYTVGENKRKNPSPYLNTNSLVSVGYKLLTASEPVTGYLFFNHTEFNKESQAESFKELQNVLDRTKLLVGHNLKFDASWLYECGFKYSGPMFDTMIAEYVFSKGRKQGLSLKACCERYNLSQKLDILQEYFDKGFNTDTIPAKDLEEYGAQDVQSTYELYLKQQSLIEQSEEHAYMEKSVRLMCETLPVLIDIERNGIYIDVDELGRVEKEYRAEYDKLKTRLQEIVVDVMGHTPINLESPEHLSWVLYSRKVKDKVAWKEVFNLGSEMRGSVLKVKYPRRYSKGEFHEIIADNTDKLYKTEAKQCEGCYGAGRIRKTKKDGTDFKKDSTCKACNGSGFIYHSTGMYAGFKLLPINSSFAAVGGFSTDKVTINELLQLPNIKDSAKEFLTSLLRINSISTYLTTFCEGIRKNVNDNLLHTSFNQCITATGRLSSSNPNFQNLPRAKTFPIRRVIKSRFEGGKIFSVDFSQLEFRVAAILGKDEQARLDIISGTDIHQFTADTITKYGQPIDRQTAKSHTFKPLFFGQSGTEAEKRYYKEFNEKYKGICRWQVSLVEEALRTGQIKSPSGRIYSFPNVKRLPNGNVSNQTQIYNYIIQGFSTGDITPVALIKIWEILKPLKSKLILTVHDDITIDVHPDDITEVTKKVIDIFKNMNLYIEERFDIKTEIPIAGDFSIGNNWMEKNKVYA